MLTIPLDSLADTFFQRGRRHVERRRKIAAIDDKWFAALIVRFFQFPHERAEQAHQIE